MTKQETVTFGFISSVPFLKTYYYFSCVFVSWLFFFFPKNLSSNYYIAIYFRWK